MKKKITERDKTPAEIKEKKKQENLSVISQCVAFLDIEEQEVLIKYMSRRFRIDIH